MWFLHLIFWFPTTVLCANLGQWGKTVTFPMVPAAAALHPQTNELILWSAYDPLKFQQLIASKTITAKYNLLTKEISKAITVTNTAHDMFCPGISLTFDGSIIVTGGDTPNKTSIYNGDWIPGGDMTIGRGYQGSTTISDGKVFVIGGSWSGRGFDVKNGELWDPESNTWLPLPGCLVKLMLTNDKEASKRDNNHKLFAWTNGSVFQAGPSINMNWYDTAGNGSVTPAGKCADDGDGMSNNAVMYNAVAGKIFIAGGSPSYTNSTATSNAYIVSINNPGENATVQKIQSMKYARVYANSVVLPDGKIFIVGGQTFAKPFSDINPNMIPELWDSETENFTDMAELPTPRNYHSIALLMPDATVFSGGGGLGGPCNCNHLDGQFYSPPYLFQEDGETEATRPEIQSIVPKEVPLGKTLEVTLKATTKDNLTFAMVRVGSATHTVNTDQRRVPLNTSSTESPYTITLPNEPGRLLPGYCMCFALNNGVPSLGEFVKVLPL